ncbi:hypothetical protein M378DRAFT_19205 [Amanita muscaria Koide BX008]|uniref:Uncharacterized protein n=1 Tax=Amanita muscaria (strain Koide BX008) TaxID=946122 RepID=A0A0C2RV34_AMAMK|nr:hypothetical protein M378DRAFT_19205 [Amanita muscaria Koide BX008]
MQQGSAFRPRLFWKVLSDFEVLPGVLDTCAFLELKFLPELEPDQTPTPIRLHTCMMSMEVTIHAYLLNLLLEPGNLDDSGSTGFDLWWHPQMLSACQGYNQV